MLLKIFAAIGALYIFMTVVVVVSVIMAPKDDEPEIKEIKEK